jgi:hypothetical protein
MHTQSACSCAVVFTILVFASRRSDLFRDVMSDVLVDVVSEAPNHKPTNK